MKTRVTEQGVTIPKELLTGMTEVEIRREDDRILIVPISDDPILQLGAQPISDDARDASENHDAHIYPA